MALDAAADVWVTGITQSPDFPALMDFRAAVNSW
jgi:hypothetical protein